MDFDSDPSQWIRGNATDYVLKVRPDGVPAGTYDLAVAIVDIFREGLNPAIELSLESDIITSDGWAKVSEVTVE